MIGGGPAGLMAAEVLAARGLAVTVYEKAMSDPAWERVAQQRIWKIHPPETEEEKLKREFFGGQDGES